MITHDERMLDVCDRILTLRDGQLKKENRTCMCGFPFYGLI